MSERTAFGPRSFAFASAALALLGGLAVVTLLSWAGPGATRWGLIGWGLMTAVGIGSGVGLVRAHGRPASAFLLAVVGSVLARLAGAALGGWAAARAGEAMVWPYLTGLAAGYLPLQILEVGWIARRAGIA